METTRTIITATIATLVLTLSACGGPTITADDVEIDTYTEGTTEIIEVEIGDALVVTHSEGLLEPVILER